MTSIVRQANDDACLRKNFPSPAPEFNVEAPAFVDLSSPRIRFSAITQKVVDTCLSSAQSQYASLHASGRVLRCVAVDQQSSNAYVVWSNDTKTDWVVLSTGLLDRLACKSRELALWLQENDLSEQFEELRVLHHLATLSPVTESAAENALEETLFATALAFYVGHEVGHSVQGHDAVYKQPLTKERKPGFFSYEHHACELEADKCGVTAGFQIGFERVLTYVNPPSTPERVAMAKLQMAHVVAPGIMLALWVQDVTSSDLESSSHPVWSLRALWLQHEVGNAFVGRLQANSQAEREALFTAAQVALYQALMLSKREKDESDPLSPYLAFRRAGTRRVLFDPSLDHYMKNVMAALPAVQDKAAKYKRF